MSCCVCAPTKYTALTGIEQCIETAFNTIRQHVLTLKDLLEEKEQNIQLELDRNSRLSKAVSLLQRSTQDLQYDTQASAEKAAAALPTTPQSEAAISPVACDDLNRAFDSEQILRCSSPNECVIAETQPVNSPIKMPAKIAKTLSALQKDNDERTVLADHSNVPLNLLDKRQQTLKTYALGKSTEITKRRAAFDSARKLRQTRLHFDFKRVAKNSVKSAPADVSKCSDEILESPIKQQKAKHFKPNPTRSYSWRRTNPKFSWEEDLEQDNDIKEKSQTTKKEVAAAETTVNEMQIDDELASRSIVIMSPKAPEVVFLDDSTTDDDATHIKTMDLLKLDARTLQRAESKCIKTAKIDKSVTETDKTIWLRPEPVKIKQETLELKSTKSQKINAQKAEQQDEEEEEDELKFFHRPVLVKKELLSPQKARDLKHNVQQADMSSMQLTPDNFWNPFIESFREDDPRKQVLRDTRLPQQRKKH